MAQGQTTLNVIIVTQGIDGTPSYTNATIVVLSTASPPPRPTPGPTPPGTEPPIAGWPTVPGWPGGSLPGGEGGWGGPPIAGWPDVPGNWPDLPGQPRPPVQPAPPELKPPTDTTPGLAAVRNAPADTPPPTDTSTWTLSQVAYGPGKIANALIGPYIEHHPA